MNVPQKMKDWLTDEGPALRRLLQSAYEAVEQQGLCFHSQASPNVIATHPQNGVNFVALWIRGTKGKRRIVSEVRVDGYRIDDLSTAMRDEIVVRRYDRGKKPLWWSLTIDAPEDIERLCLVIKRLVTKLPDWGSRAQ